MRRLLLYIVFVISVLGSANTYAQDLKLISGDFAGMRFDDFVKKIESSGYYKFYYKNAELDSIVVNTKASSETLDAVLKRIFTNTSFNFTIDQSNNVFVTLRVKIQPDLIAGFFDRSTISKDTTVGDNYEEVDSAALKNLATIENKLFDIGIRTSTILRGNVALAGYVRDRKNGEAISGAAVYIDTPSVGTFTDQFGYFSLTVPRGRNTLKISSAGMKDTRRQLMVYSSGKLNIEMDEFIPSLKAVVVVAERRSNVKSTQMGFEKLTIKAIKQVPVVFGEADVLRVVMALPGVTAPSEGTTGFNVRGGSSDQNLILYNDATIYNPSHLFGFFSAFNPDVVKGVELYKSGIPEKFGGRLSSVLDVSTRDGNNKKFTGIAGIGPLTSKLTIEGPLKKDKASFIIGGRSTYSNWLMKKIPNESYRNSRASFYDINFHISSSLSSKNSLFLTGYISNDRFNLNNDTSYRYSNQNANLKWKHIFNNKLYGVVTTGVDHYNFDVSASRNPVNAYKLSFNITQFHFRNEYSFSLNQNHSLNFGFNSIYYKLNPGSYKPVGDRSLVSRDILETEQALESALYVGDKITVGSNLSMNLGIRYSLFNYLGPQKTYSYVAGLPRRLDNIVDSTQHGSGTIKQYHGPEYRVSARYSLSDNSSLKLSYNSLIQYIHMLSNTTVISPTDIWKLSDPNIRPQRGQQLSFGYYRNFASNTIETSVEVYHKKMKDYLDFKSNAVLLMNHHIETDVINTRGKSYGVEFMIKKVTGKINGWFSYTYSRAFLQMDDPIAGEIINRGEYYPASFDKPHNVNLIGNYRLSHRFSVSLNVVYNTGRPITLPIAVYNYAGSQRLYYSDRNQYRIPDYFRMDLSMNIEGNHKIKKLTHNSWSFGVYNLTGRQNAYSVFFVEENGYVKGYKLSIFGTIIPFVTYNFRF